MKKILVLSSLLVAFAGTSYATELKTATVSNVAAAIYCGPNKTAAEAAKSPTIKLSNKVNGVVNFAAGTTTADAGTSAHYVIFTKHSGGSKTFGTGDDTTNVYYKVAPATVLDAAPFSEDTGGKFLDNTLAWTSL